MRGSLASSSVLMLLLSACHSSVGICGEVEVCGSDGTTYADRCAAGSAGVDVMYEGACPFECPPVLCDEGFTLSLDGCACDPIAPADVGVDARVDAGRVDTGRGDADEPDSEPDPCGTADTEVLCSSGGAATCVDLESDHTNCGSCGNRCPSSRSCISGSCVPTRCRDVGGTVSFEPGSRCEATCADVMWSLDPGGEKCTRTEIGDETMTTCPGVSAPTTREQCLRALIACCGD